ncbi:MAG: signal peptidase [Solirubrobacteraceae bacterium]|jgi:signal peptidase I|nr:signal peptidase [Solirubrobacteraceae bacterium]
MVRRQLGSRVATTRRLLATGFAFVPLSLVAPAVAVVPIAIGIIAIVGGRTRQGIAMIVLASLLALTGAILIASFLRPYRIPSGAMEPTLERGDRIVALRHAGVRVGDVVVFHPPAGAARPECGIRPRADQMCGRAAGGEDRSISFVKRIVAGPGDSIALRSGHVVLNGKARRENFINECGGPFSCDYPRAITVPAKSYFMLGDNRGESDDSRFWGPVPESWVVGRALLIYWPPRRGGTL